MKLRQSVVIAAFAVAFSSLSSSVETKIEYLSGHDGDDPVEWSFRCSNGQNSGRWTTIGVPSCWEQEGYGEYTYGRFYLDKSATPSSERGEYLHSFEVPADWKGKRVELVFEGVMTDANVKINGKQAGPVHQGGFTAFSYDISRLLYYGKVNKLEVVVDKESANKSVNAAERRADWWLFGGIYRPVYLRVLPVTHIDRVAADARADGTLNLRLFTRNLPKGTTLDASIGRHEIKSVALGAKDDQTLSLRWDSVKTWDPEHPNMYELTLTLRDRKGIALHTHREKIGFRTLEFVPRDGFYLNGTRLVMKGINRHCFYPETGRTTSRRRDRDDLRLLKGMNVNAIRSHYSPDRHLLELCDSMGILYFDELAGWQDAYDTIVGTKILTEMLVHDVNHPCIFAWGNGNEGGFNYGLLPLFTELDPQKRFVAHAWALSGGLDTHHYPAYQTGVGRLSNGYQVFMPTEFLHSQYDKGGGAGLEDFWSNYSANPLFAGGFIWAMKDEGIMRTDQGGRIDTDGGNAPDGIVGPHGEKEGSWYTIRDIWSPVQINPVITVRGDRAPRLSVTNRSLFSNLTDYTLRYEVVKADIDDGERIVAQGLVNLPGTAPGETANVTVSTDGNLSDGDFLRLTALNEECDTVNIWTFPLKYADEYHASHTVSQSGEKASVEDGVLTAAGVRAAFDTTTGMLEGIWVDGHPIPFANGPIAVGMKMELTGITSRMEGDTAVMTMRYRGAVDSIVWRMTPAGVLGMDALMLNRKNGGGFKGEFIDTEVRNLGLSFSYPEELCDGMTWYGKGPYRVWRNRQRGVTYGIWHKDYNNTVTGQPDDNGVLTYPEFKGYHANTYRARLHSIVAPLEIASETDGLYLRLFTPEEPRVRATNTMVRFPEGDISFLFEIPPMRSYKPLDQLGPGGIAPNIRINKGDEGLRMKLWFKFKE